MLQVAIDLWTGGAMTRNSKINKKIGGENERLLAGAMYTLLVRPRILTCEPLTSESTG